MLAITAAAIVLVSQLGHNSHVHAVAISPDGRLALTASEDLTAKLWEVETGAELRTLSGHTKPVKAVAFSPDGRFALTGSADESARLWELSSGTEVRKYSAGRGGVNGVAFSPDGRSIAIGSWDFTARTLDTGSGEVKAKLSGHTAGILAVAWSANGQCIATGSYDNTAKLWDAQSGALRSTFTGHGTTVTSVAVSRDCSFVLTGSMDRTARLWDAKTGAELRTFRGHGNDITSVAFSPDERTILTASFDHTAKLWNAQTGEELRTLQGHQHWLSSIAISSDGRAILTGSHDRTAKLWDAATGQEILRLSGRISLPSSAAFSPDDRYLVTATRDHTAKLWEGPSGRQLDAYADHDHWATSVAYSPDGKLLVTGSWDATVKVWDAASGVKPRTLYGLGEPAMSVAFSADGTRLLAGGWNGTVKLWDAATGTELRSFTGRGEHANSTAISPDGRFVATCRDGRAILWDANSGAEVRAFAGHVAMLKVRAVAFSPDGRQLLTGGGDATAKLWDIASGAELRTFAGHADTVDAVAFSPDGRFVLTGSSDHTAKIWDAATGALAHTLTGHRGFVHSISVSHDGRLVLTTSTDGTTALWEFSSGQLLCSLVSFDDGSWTVIDPIGRFDASNGGNVQGLHWLAANEAIGLDQLKDRYYVPQLLAKILGFDRKPLDALPPLDAVSLYPGVEVEPLKPGATTLTIHLTDRGGGFGKVRVLVNRKELTTVSGARGGTITVDLSQAPVLPREKNHIEVLAWNRDDSLSNRGVIVEWTPPAGESYEPELYAIIGGISEYAAPSMALRYAAKDAADMATAIELAGRRLLGAGRVHLTLLTTAQDPRAQDPTRANFEKAFEAAARNARPGDVLLVYLAGHGAAVPGNAKLYAYYTREAAGFDLTSEETRHRRAITSEDLTSWIKPIRALKQVMILDTCAAGVAAERLIELRAVPGEQLRAIERLKDRTGFHILMGSTADAVSYEASRYGRGLLTHALLEGMKGAALYRGEFVDVDTLFQYAIDEVPRLAKGIGGIQRPWLAAPRGSSFEFGQLTPDDRKLIEVHSPRPWALPPVLFNPDQNGDNLRLTSALKQSLCATSAVVCLQADDQPQAISVAGAYRVEGDRVRVSLTLRRDGETLTQLRTEGSVNALPALIETLTQSIVTSVAGVR